MSYILPWRGSSGGGGGTGTVTSVSVNSGNGLGGSVSNPTTTPAISLSTSVTGIVKANGTGFLGATAGTDYVAPGAVTTSGLTMATARLLGRSTASTGAIEAISIGTNLTLAAGVLSASGGGGGSGTVNSGTLNQTAYYASTGTTVSGTFNDPAKKMFNPLAYGAVADGTTDNTTAFANMMTDVLANGGGTIYVPNLGGVYKFAGSNGWTINAYGLATGIKIYLNGATFFHTGTGACINIPTNYFPPTGDGFRRSIIIRGDGATIIGTGSGAAGLAWTDVMFSQFDNFYIQGYSAGYGVHGQVTGTNFSEDIQLTRVATNTCKNSFAFTSASHASSFDGMYLKDLIAGDGGVTGGALFTFDCLVSRGTFINVGGFYSSGSVGFLLNGMFQSSSFIGPWIDNAGGGESNPATDITFGPNYDPGGPAFIANLINPSFIQLPPDWWDFLTVTGGRGYTYYSQIFDPTEVQRVLFIQGHAPSGVGAGSQLVTYRTLQSGDFYNLDWSGNHVYGAAAVGSIRTAVSFGYGGATGVGGTVTQGTSKSTGVTLNKLTGAITMNAAALAAGAKVSFAVSNTTVAANDVPMVCVTSGGTANAYRASVTAVGSNTFTITVENITAGSLSEAPVINFNVIKGTNA